MIHYDFDDDDDDENDDDDDDEDDDDDDDDCKCGATSGLDGTCLYHRLFRLKSYERLSVVLIELQGLGFYSARDPIKIPCLDPHLYHVYMCIPFYIIHSSYENHIP